MFGTFQMFHAFLRIIFDSVRERCGFTIDCLYEKNKKTNLGDIAKRQYLKFYLGIQMYRNLCCNKRKL